MADIVCVGDGEQAVLMALSSAPRKAGGDAALQGPLSSLKNGVP